MRLADMDATGIAKQILSLTSPGVQIFESAEATALARSSNDRLAEAIRRHPERFAGLAAIAPQDPAGAAKELERGVRSLGLKGAIVNSHTRGEYLDDEKFWEIFEAAESLDVPIYIHPNTPSARLIEPFLDRGLAGAVYGFAVETSLHMLRLVVSGVFDRFPKLRIVVGHLGEGLPYWLFRIDFMYGRGAASNRFPNAPKLARKPSEYLKGNFYVTTSGMAWEPVILYAQQVLGVDRVLYAMDYPYQFVPEEVGVTDNLPIGDADKKKLYQTNAERVFAL
jgi:2,3-dihydroxybenzoate decarboxylase